MTKGKMLYESLKQFAVVHEFKFRTESWEQLDENTKQYFDNAARDYTNKMWEVIRSYE